MEYWFQVDLGCLGYGKQCQALRMQLRQKQEKWVCVHGAVISSGAIETRIHPGSCDGHGVQ
jgi:hypothetical protein